MRPHHTQLPPCSAPGRRSLNTLEPIHPGALLGGPSSAPLTIRPIRMSSKAPEVLLPSGTPAEPIFPVIAVPMTVLVLANPGHPPPSRHFHISHQFLLAGAGVTNSWLRLTSSSLGIRALVLPRTLWPMTAHWQSSTHYSEPARVVSALTYALGLGAAEFSGGEEARSVSGPHQPLLKTSPGGVSLPITVKVRRWGSARGLPRPVTLGLFPGTGSGERRGRGARPRDL